ncbi:MAG TPA: alpha-E domain-containing protein [Leeuwenhoekiella sp.]|nr:alpha-E domain-containing protein [Leeuwenhoekiella sp.]
MLARVANNLFWMGRYIERAEHIARYLNVNYFSSLDAPNEQSQSRQLVLRSMLCMADDTVPENVELNEEEVLYDIALNTDKSFSIINCVKIARENANSARDLISTELYESINKFYHYVLNYDVDYFKNKGLYDFTVNVTEFTAILRGKIRGTLLHDKVYAIIMLGINIERSTQIVRIIHAKFLDAKKAKGNGEQFKQSSEWTTLLKCVESYDMNRRHYRQPPTKLTTLEFLILNPFCPRSVMNSINQVANHINTLSTDKYPAKDSAAYLIGKTQAEYKFKSIESIEGEVADFIEEMLDCLWLMAQKIEKEYFNY